MASQVGRVGDAAIVECDRLTVSGRTGRLSAERTAVEDLVPAILLGRRVVTFVVTFMRPRRPIMSAPYDAEAVAKRCGESDAAFRRVLSSACYIWLNQAICTSVMTVSGGSAGLAPSCVAGYLRDLCGR
jgi:hypothetical protein